MRVGVKIRAVSAGGRPEACLYAALDSPPECHDRLLLELVAPIVREIGNDERLDSLFFVRFADPTWQLRFRVLGRPDWIDDAVRPLLSRAIGPFAESGVIKGVEYGEYAREWDRYGGPLGMELAERMFLQDSLSCLDLLEAESKGRLLGSRREYSLRFTERFLDLFKFDDARRRRFYLEGHSWAFRDGVFREEDRPRLARQYAGVRDALLRSIRDSGADDPASVFGGPEPARIATAALIAMRPVADQLLAAHAEGSIRQDLVYLAWSYAHLHCNRLGIDVVPEAILRYLMFRAYDELAGPPG